MTNTVAAGNRIAITSVDTVSPGFLFNGVSLLHSDFLARHPFTQPPATRDYRSLQNLRDGLTQRPNWALELAEEGIPVGQTVTDVTLDYAAKEAVLRRPGLVEEWETLALALGEGARLLKTDPTALFEEKNGSERLTVLPPLATTRLLQGGRDLIGTHPLSMHFVRGEPSVEDLKKMMDGSEAPIRLDGNYVTFWSSLHAWLRLARWPEAPRRNLTKICGIITETASNRFDDIDTDALQRAILSGPDPLLYGRFRERGGFYGALFHKLADGILRPYMGDPEMQRFLLDLKNRFLRRLPADFPERAEILRAADVLSAYHTHFGHDRGVRLS